MESYFGKPEIKYAFKSALVDHGGAVDLTLDWIDPFESLWCAFYDKIHGIKNGLSLADEDTGLSNMKLISKLYDSSTRILSV